MSRKVAREAAMQALFQLDFNFEGEDSLDLALGTALEEHEDLSDQDKDYATTLVRGTMEQIKSLDEKLTTASKKWKLSRMGAVERSILRLAAYEMEHMEGITAAIAINEAVELAKKYGADNSASFVNGILGALVPREA